MIRPNEVTIFDLTGSDGRFVRQHGWYGILGSDRTICLGEPVYFGSLVLEVRRGDRWELLVDWNSDVEVIDSENLMPVYRYLYQERYHQEVPADTSHQLCNAVKLNAVYLNEQAIEDLPLRATYQAFFLDPVARVRANLGPIYTPGLMREVIERLDHLQSVINGFAVDSDGVHLIHGTLPLDLTGQTDKNHVRNEPYYVDTRTGATVIIPKYGKFYGYDIRLVYQNEVLQERVDYELTGLDIARTKISEPASGVYTFIRIKRAMRTTEEDPLLVSYHAFGGTVTNRMYDDIALELSWLHSRLAFMLTQDNLAEQPVISDLQQRVEGIERQLQLTRLQTYSYSNPFTNRHRWKTVAKYDLSRILPDQNWPLHQAIANFRISYNFITADSTDNPVQQEFSLSFSRNAATGGLKFTTKLLSTQAPTLTDDDIAYFDKRITTKLRLVWQSSGDEPTNILHGPFLQVALIPCESIYKQYNDETFSTELQVEVLTTSFVNDVWTLLEPNTSMDGNSTCTVIPGTESYSLTQASVHALYRTLNPGDLVCFYGALPLQATPSLPETVSDDWLNNDSDYVYYLHLTPSYGPSERSLAMQLNLSQVYGASITVYDRYLRRYHTVSTDSLQRSNRFLRGELLFDELDLCRVHWSYNQDADPTSDAPENAEVRNKGVCLKFDLGTASKVENRFILHKFALLLR